MSVLKSKISKEDLEKYNGLYRGLEVATSGPLSAIRKISWEQLQELGFPHDSDESWKYTRPSELIGESLGLSENQSSLEPWNKLMEKHLGSSSDAVRIVFVSGKYRKDLSSQNELVQGLRIESFRNALADPKNTLAALLENGVEQENGAFAALNGALLEDGAWIHLSKDCISARAIELVFLSGGEDDKVISNPRTVIQMEEGSRAEIREIYLSAQGKACFTNAVSHVYLGQASHLDHLRLQMEDINSKHMSSLCIQQGRDSFYGSSNIGIGAALARTDLRINLNGKGSECILNGLFLGKGNQHADLQTQVSHGAPRSTSRQFFKIILDDKSTGVFNGRILVLQEAQKTVASQENRNLLLSKAARINTKPQLEIYADDVKCNHGDTVGALDENALYYLKSRGLAQSEAKKILTQAFAQDILDLIPEGSFRSTVEAKVGKWFESRMIKSSK